MKPWAVKKMKQQKRFMSGQDTAALDYCLTCGRTILLLSYFDRSLITVKAIGASFSSKYAEMCLFGGYNGRDAVHHYGAEYEYYTTAVDGYDPFYQGVVINKELHKKYLITTDSREPEDFYNFLMRNYDLPLMYEWKDVLWKWAQGKVCRSDEGLLFAPDDKVRMIRLPDGSQVNLEEIKVYHIGLSQEELDNAVSALLRTGAIKITDIPQKPLEFKNMDEYFTRYGNKLVKQLKKDLKPLMDYEKEVSGFTLKHKRLYPQQAAMVNGIANLLGGGTGKRAERRKNRSTYAILNQGMGVGKTIQALSICEALGVSKELRKGRTLKEVYLD